MKKLIILLCSLFSVFASNAQESTYKAIATELYSWNKLDKSWDLHTKNSNTTIIVVVEKEFITFQAKSPSMYKVYVDTKKPLDTKSMTGYRYDAKDLKNDTFVKVDVLKEIGGSLLLVSIINDLEGFNLRFFMVAND